MQTWKTVFQALAAIAIVTAASPAALSAENGDPQASTQGIELSKGAVKDAWLQGKVETALLFNEFLNPFDIDTDVKNGVVYLQGAVESDIHRDLAGEIAKSIDGISDVENELVIDKAKALEARASDDSQPAKTFRQKIINATLTARVKTQLLMNPNTSGLQIDVDTRDGIVTLSGEVDSREERELAFRIAENTEGAVAVNNHLTTSIRAETS